MKLKKTVLAMTASVVLLNSAFAVGCNPNVDGVQWYHNSAEKKALYYQAFNVAYKKIKHEVKKQHLQKDSWGVVLDIDETTLDNSWAEYANYKNYKFSPSEQEEGKASAVPGVVKFTHMIHDLGGYVTLLTNRAGNTKKMFDATVANVKKVNVYFDQVIFSNSDDKDSGNKTPRFEAVESGNYTKNIILTNTLPAHKLLAYFGDNIQDFPNLTQKQMQKAPASAFDEFGSKYFMMPNPMYGSWQ